MTTITLPLEEYQELIRYKENWEKGRLMYCFMERPYFISEEDFKIRMEDECKQRGIQLNKDLEAVKTQLKEARGLRDACAKEASAIADSMKTPRRADWLSKIFQLRRKFK